MFDVGDLPLLTFGDCVLKTRVNEWPLKLYARLFMFFSQNSQKNMTVYFFQLLNTFSRPLSVRSATCAVELPTMFAGLANHAGYAYSDVGVGVGVEFNAPLDTV